MTKEQLEFNRNLETVEMGWYDYKMESRAMGFSNNEFLEMTYFDFLFERIVKQRNFEENFIIFNASTIQLINTYLGSKGVKDKVSVNDFLNIKEIVMPSMNEFISENYNEKVIKPKIEEFKRKIIENRKGVNL